ncbi:MAG: response regulator [Cyanophyceae cyanobacterium]
MVADATIREQGYVYFVSESRDLLETIEEELFLLREDPKPARIHALMRATHTLKGASANVGLETIQTIAHHMEDIFRTLFDPDAAVDVELEALLFESYECLRLALTGEFEGNHARDEEILATAVDVFAKIQEQLGDCFGRDVPIPTSAELGFDIVQSIFESGVQERIQELEQALQGNDQRAIAEMLTTQSEIFVGLGESLALPGFTAIAEAMQTAAENFSDRFLEVGAAALEDLKAAHTLVLGGDRERGGKVSALAVFVGGSNDTTVNASSVPDATENNILDLGDWGDGDILDLTESWDQEELSIPDPAAVSIVPPDTAPPGMVSPDITPPDITPPSVIPPSVIPPDIIAPVAAEPASAGAMSPPAPEPTPAAIAPSGPAVPIDAKPTPARQGPSKPGQLIRVELDRLQELQHLVGELLIQQNRQSLQDEQLQTSLKNFRSRLQKHRRLLGQLRDRTRALGMTHDALDDPMAPDLAGRFRSKTPSKLGRLQSLEEDSLAELVDATVAEAESLEDTVEVVERYSQQTAQTTDKQRRLLGSVRDSLMDARMQPVSTVFRRFPQLVKQLVARYHKPVELRLLGERVAIDKAAIESLYDPILHLVRNAFDHGIESPEARRGAGKAETGIIQLQALQQGNQVLIIVSDDGGGIDPEVIRRKARDRRWRDPATLDRMEPSALFDMLFEPGFSTADQVSDLSGRGVGLDVVREQMASLKGSVSVQSILGRGTVFILRVPLSLMTARLLVCHADRAVYALLSDSISQILIPDANQTHILGGQRVLRWQQGDDPEITLPVRKLSDLVHYGALRPGKLLPDMPALTPVLHNRLAPLMLLRSDDGLVAIEVDGVVGEQELVLRQLSEAIPSPDYIYGCTILGDGRMALVLDGGSLLERSDIAPASITPDHIVTTALGGSAIPAVEIPQSAAPETVPPETVPPEKVEAAPVIDDEPSEIKFVVPPQPAAPPTHGASPSGQSTLLVVEDSETERNILALTLEKSGFKVVQAEDGQEALDQLKKHPQVQLVISDLEMPRMGGLEFLSARRQDPVIAQIPVMMLTSCSGKQYQQIAAGLGAAKYMTKPHVTQELLDNINSLIAH